MTDDPVRRVAIACQGGGSHTAFTVRELCNDVRMDLTRKQLTRERAAWTVRLDGSASNTQGRDGQGRDEQGRIEATFDDGRVVRVRLGPAAL